MISIILILIDTESHLIYKTRRLVTIKLVGRSGTGIGIADFLQLGVFYHKLALLTVLENDPHPLVFAAAAESLDLTNTKYGMPNKITDPEIIKSGNRPLHLGLGTIIGGHHSSGQC